MGNILIENGKAVGAFGNPIPANLVSYNGSNVETALDKLNSDIVDRTFHTKAVPIAGTTLSNYYGEVYTGIDTTKYKAIAICEGGNWDQKCSYSICDDGTRIYIKCIESSYTIPSTRSDLSVIYVSKNAFA